MSKLIEKAWNKTRGENPKYDEVSLDFKAKLNSVYADAVAGQPSSGIAGLEEFEAEVRKAVESDKSLQAMQNLSNKPASSVDAAAIPNSGQARTSDSVATLQASEGSPSAERTPKGSGAQDSEEGSQAKAEKDAAGAHSRVEASEVHSPSAPSAARQMAAESPANATPTKKASAKSATKKAAKKASK
jgi:hypothetical protein